MKPRKNPIKPGKTQSKSRTTRSITVKLDENQQNPIDNPQSPSPDWFHWKKKKSDGLSEFTCWSRAGRPARSVYCWWRWPAANLRFSIRCIRSHSLEIYKKNRETVPVFLPNPNCLANHWPRSSKKSRNECKKIRPQKRILPTKSSPSVLRQVMKNRVKLAKKLAKKQLPKK